MGHDVHLSLIMNCNDSKAISELANKHIDKVRDCTEAIWFLEYISEGKGVTNGPKGSLFTWGIVGNYTYAGHFVEILMPFWKELFNTEIGPLNFEHIIVFYEPEQSEQASCYEISYCTKSNKVIIQDHRLPFAWMQF